MAQEDDFGGSASPSGARTRVQSMAASLKALLDQAPNARQVFSHLAALETDLANHGLVVLQKVPLKALMKVSRELASLPMRQDDLALQDLGTVLLAELEARTQTHGQFLSTFASAGRLEVSEASHSDFLEAMAHAAQDKPSPKR